MVTGNLRVRNDSAPEEEIGEEKRTNRGNDNYKKTEKEPRWDC